MKNENFKGRYNELSELNRRYVGGKKEFGVVYGRRRIGKSILLGEFIEDKKGLFFQAKKNNSYGNLSSFSYELNKLLNQPKGFVYSSWEEVFDVINELSKEQRFVLIIDEYPYIVEQEDSFPSVLQEFIDRANENLFLIISGSDVSLLKKEIKDHASPLYKRRTFEMAITKMPHKEAIEFLSKYDDETKCNYLALMSSYPYYLAAIDLNLSFEENVQNLLFNQYGSFFTLPDQLLSNSTKVQDVYNAILNAIAHRRTTNKEIADYIHEEEAKVSKYLTTLLESELVIKCETFMGNKKTNYYQIGDPLLKFWYYFIFENQERIKINGQKVFEELKEKIYQFISYGFEDVCKLFLTQLNIDGKLEDVFPEIQTYRVEKSILNRSIEIDGLSSVNNKLMIVECKYRKTQFDLGMLIHLIESVSVFPNRLDKSFYIFSKSGFTDEVKAYDKEVVHLYELKDLF